MTEPIPEGGIETGRIEIVLYLDPDGRQCSGYLESDDLGLIEVLGVLSLAKDSAIRMRMEDDE